MKAVGRYRPGDVPLRWHALALPYRAHLHQLGVAQVLCGLHPLHADAAGVGLALLLQGGGAAG